MTLVFLILSLKITFYFNFAFANDFFFFFNEFFYVLQCIKDQKFQFSSQNI